MAPALKADQFRKWVRLGSARSGENIPSFHQQPTRWSHDAPLLRVALRQKVARSVTPVEVFTRSMPEVARCNTIEVSEAVVCAHRSMATWVSG